MHLIFLNSIHFKFPCLLVSKFMSSKLFDFSPCSNFPFTVFRQGVFAIRCSFTRQSPHHVVFHKSIGMSAMDVEATNVFFNSTMANTKIMNEGFP